MQGKREQFSGFNRTLDAINNVFRKFSAFHDETGRLNVDGMNIISNDGSNKLNRSRKARVSYKVQRTINASLNAATSTRAVSSNPNFVTRLFLNPQCLASISRWITASSSWKRFCLFVCRALSSIMVICMLTAIRLLLTFVMSLYLLLRS